MRIALIGLGDIAQKAYLPLLATNEQITPLLCTRNSAVLARLSQQYRIADCFSDIDELFAAAPDGVMIHAATPAHVALATKSLLAGIPTFVDKPLATSSAEVEQLCDLASQMDCPLFVGFNRRYLPAMDPVRGQPLTELQWQKHRHDLPGEPRTFLFDDFIHVLDSLCFYGGEPDRELLGNFRASSQQPQQLAAVSVSWQCGERAISGSMNRSAGITEERISAYRENLSLHLESCTRGTLAQDKVVRTLVADDWQPILAQRGFSAMLAHWYQQIALGKSDSKLLDSYLQSHRLAEQLTAQAVAHLQLRG